MKVLLLNPPITYDTPQAPLGLMMLHASLKERHDVTILDLNFALDREKLRSLNADVIGISCMTFQRDLVIEIAKLMKEDGLFIVVGGAHPTISPKEMLKHPCIDYVIRGEGEHAFSQLLNALEEDSPLNGVANLGYRKNDRVQLNLVEEIEDLNSLPFPSYDALDMHRYATREPTSTVDVPYETARGCPFNCIFCCVNRMRGSYRAMSLDRVFSDIEKILDLHQADSILLNFFDNNFTFSRERSLEFCDRLRDIPGNSRIKWMCSARADELDHALIRKMSNAGAVKIFIGGESGYDHGLKMIQKRVSIAQIKDAVKACLRYRIRAEVGFIIGFPWEKKKDILRTLSTAMELEKIGAITGLYKCVPYPATPLWRHLEERNIKIDSSRSSDFDFFADKLVFDHPYIANSDLNSTVRALLDHKMPLEI